MSALRQKLYSGVLTFWVFVVSTLIVQAQTPRDLGPDTPKILSELDALKIGKLYAERQVIEQALLKLAAQQESLRAQTQLTRSEYDRKAQELSTVVLAAAKDAGLTAEDLKAGWAPNPEERKWVKTETKP